MQRKVNKATLKKYSLKRLAKQRKKITPQNNNNGGIFSGKVSTIR